MRINWEEYALDIARTASKRSQDPYVKVGACALDVNNMIVAAGYNGLAAGKEVPNLFWSDREARRPYMIHAEANCLSMCKKGTVKILAVTLLPCSSCATLIASYGIKKVVYGEDYDKDMLAKDIFKFYNIELRKI
tara:strand:- start:7984 stop:8388 length:405 start_codon:yes stop_codon:yes gene_type:complete